MGNEKRLLPGCRVSIGAEGKVLELDSAMVAPHGDCTVCHSIVAFKMVKMITFRLSTLTAVKVIKNNNETTSAFEKIRDCQNPMECWSTPLMPLN